MEERTEGRMEELVRATANFATRLENDDATAITIYVWRVRLAKRPPLSLSPSRKDASASWYAGTGWFPPMGTADSEKRDGKGRGGGGRETVPIYQPHIYTRTHTGKSLNVRPSLYRLISHLRSAHEP